MGILIDEKERFFCIETKNTEYQMKVDFNNVLKHIWYGNKTGMDMEYVTVIGRDIGGSGNLYEMKDVRSYSLNTIPLEYPCAGAGDFRISAFDVRFENGTGNPDLRFEGFKVFEGKYGIPNMPAVYCEGSAETLEIYLKDTTYNLSVTLRYGVVPEYDVITRCAVITNNGDDSVKIENAMSGALDLPDGEWDWVHFYGRHCLERQAERGRVMHGIQESSSKRGISGHQENPAVIICRPDTSETSGECYGAMLVYSGNFSARIQKDELNKVRLTMGINPELFSWKLDAGESFYTPEVVFSYSASGFEKLSHNLHKLVRNNICRGKYKYGQRPVLINNWEATYFDFNEEKILNIAKQAAELGVEMLVMDDGWFGKRNDDKSSLGDWFVNTDKLKGGLAPLVKQINELGMKFGIWFEPEMISEDSLLFSKHPEWALRIPERKPVMSRCQLVLDMSRQDVVDYLFERISSILNSANISYIKWDMNRGITDWYSAELSAKQMGELPHRYVLGLYSLLQRVTNAFPDVMIEGCSAGGGRFDAGMLYYCPQIWCSDDTDAYERTKIQYGTSFFYPVSAVGSHISAVPNHQTGRVTPFETRAITAMAGSFGYELDLNNISAEEKEEVKLQIKRFKEYDSLIHSGDYYRLSKPHQDNYAAWGYVSENKSEALYHIVQFRTEPNFSLRICLRGLDKNSTYILAEDGKKYTGAALMSGGVLLPAPSGDYVPYELYLKRV